MPQMSRSVQYAYIGLKSCSRSMGNESVYFKEDMTFAVAVYVVVLQMTGKQYTKIQNACVEVLFHSLNLFWVLFSSTLTSWFGKVGLSIVKSLRSYYGDAEDNIN